MGKRIFENPKFGGCQRKIRLSNFIREYLMKKKAHCYEVHTAYKKAVKKINKKYQVGSYKNTQKYFYFLRRLKLIERVECPICKGTGKIEDKYPCSSCKGTGRVIIKPKPNYPYAYPPEIYRIVPGAENRIEWKDPQEAYRKEFLGG